jgi:hypothetical protein
MRPIVDLLFAIIFAMGACSGVKPRSQDNLNEAVLLFNEGVRWGRLQEVMPRLAPDNTAHFLEMHEGFGKEVKVSDYEIINTNVDWEKQTAVVMVKVTWYRITQMEEFTTVISQRWEEIGGEWMMMAETYQTGEPF